MGVAGRQINEEFGASGSTAARISAVAVEAASTFGCTVIAVGPGQYRLTRRYRKSWIVPAAVVGSVLLGLGLLLLLIPKVVEECTVTISEDRRGVKVRVAGVAPQQFVDDVRVACAAPASAPPVRPVPAVGPTPTSFGSATSPFAPAPLHVPPAMPQTRPAMVSMPTTPPSWAATSSVPPQPQVSAVTHSPASIRIGQQVTLVGAGITVGRNPGR